MAWSLTTSCASMDAFLRRVAGFAAAPRPFFARATLSFQASIRLITWGASSVGGATSSRPLALASISGPNLLGVGVLVLAEVEPLRRGGVDQHFGQAQLLLAYS